MSRRTDEVNETLQRLVDEVAELRHRTEMMQLVFVVKEPDAVRAAEAYDGLRKQIIASSAERRAHLAQVVEMAVTCRRAESVADVSVRVDEWMAQSGIAVISDPRRPGAANATDLFEIVGDNDGQLTVVEPAYVDGNTGSIVRRGLAERSASQELLAAQVVASPPDPEPAPTPEPIDQGQEPPERAVDEEGAGS